MNNVIENAKDLVTKIYEQMGKVEKCDAIMESIRGCKFVFCKDEDDEVVYLDGVMTPEQIEQITQSIFETITSNKSSAENYLASITGDKTVETVKEDSVKVEPAAVYDEPRKKAAVINQDFEDAVQDMIDSSNKQDKAKADKVKKAMAKVEKAKPTKKYWDIEMLKNMYINQGMTLQQIAEELGVGRTSVYDAIKAAGIKKPSKRDQDFKDGGKAYGSR